MKKIILVIGVMVSCICPGSMAHAGVANSEHDMYAQGKGTDQNVCSYCHVPHNAIGERIWAGWAGSNVSNLTSGPYGTIGNMCYTCHDGTVAHVPLQELVFNTSTQQHKGDCNLCHNVHDNTNQYFMKVPATKSNDSGMATYCETCHGSTPYTGAEHLGNHLAGSQHPYKKTGSGTSTGSYINGSCYSCHAPHGAANITTEALTNPILRQPLTNSEICMGCHNDYDKAGEHKKHPVSKTSSGQWGNLTCISCHDVHQPDQSGRKQLLVEDNVKSSFCLTCHHATDAAKGPSIGEHGHPTEKGFASTGALLAANELDDDGDSSPDYPSSGALLICESCHSMHSKGVDAPLLRASNTNSSICTQCHKATGSSSGPSIGDHSHPIGQSFSTTGLTPSGSDIDDDGNGPDYVNNTASMVCETCHSVHNKAVDVPLLRVTKTGGALCVNCHTNK